MSQDQVLGVFREAILVSLKLSGPMLMISIVIGLIIAVFQAATQIHEQTLTFVPKVLGIAVILLVCGSWMIMTLNELVYSLFDIIARL